MDISHWTQTFFNAISSFWETIASFLPNIIAVIIIAIAGLILSRLISKWLGKLIEKLGFNTLCTRIGVSSALKKMGVSSKPDQLIRKLIAFFLILFIVLTCAEILGLDRVTHILDEFILYLPKLLGALLVIFIGAFVAQKAKGNVKRSFENLGMDYASSVARFIQIVILLTTFSLAIGQLQIETQMLNIVITIVLSTFAIATAISLGIGTKDVTKNIVSGIYAREQFQPGDTIFFDDYQGSVVQVGTVNTVLENDEGERLSIPNDQLLQTRFRYLDGSNESGSQ